MTDHLVLQLGDVPVADVRPGGPRGPVLRWLPGAAREFGLGSPALSCLLPVSTPDDAPHPGRVLAFLGGLLPEAETVGRSVLASRLGVLPSDVHALLAEYGRDLIGATVLVPAPGPAGPGELTPVTDDDIAQRLLDPDLAWSTLGTGGSSLPGVQHKIALHRGLDGRWYRASGGAASTHILKPEHPGDARLVDHEAASLRLAHRAGCTTIRPEVVRFGREGVRALVLDRFDRVREGGAVRRRHQEDAAQALGLNPNALDAKFQRGPVGPSLAAVAALLRGHGGDLTPLLALTVLNTAVGNTDAHAKNLGLLHDRDAVALAPAYDVSPHLHRGSWRMAMSVGGEVDARRLTRAHLIDEGRLWGLPAARVSDTVDGVLTALADAAGDPAVWLDSEPGVVRGVVDRIAALRGERG